MATLLEKKKDVRPMWHPALYEHPVLPFRYKREGPRFCSEVVEQDVRTRQDARTVFNFNSIEFRGGVVEQRELTPDNANCNYGSRVRTLDHVRT